MTYCVAIQLEEGQIFISDTRTNAGVDHISSFRKMTSFSVAGERVLVLQTSGSLATSQAVVAQLRQDIERHVSPNLLDVQSVFEAAELIGRYSRQHAKEASELAGVDAGFSSSFLLGGQIGNQPSELYQIYPEGNFIKASTDTHFFQIGETKYGKPILDRSLSYHSKFENALKAALVSFDSTIRSNLSVGFPLDMILIKKDSKAEPKLVRIDSDDPYFNDVQHMWSEGLKQTLANLPDSPDYYWGDES